MESEVEELRDRLAANLNDRESGKALCEVKRSPGGTLSDEDRLSAFLSASCGLTLAPGALRPMARDVAAFVAEELLVGPTWGLRPEDRTEAREAASRFLAQFNSTARFSSTYNVRINQTNATYTSSGAGLLNNSFDMGILAADDEHVGILWLGDED